MCVYRGDTGAQDEFGLFNLEGQATPLAVWFQSRFQTAIPTLPPLAPYVGRTRRRRPEGRRRAGRPDPALFILAGREKIGSAPMPNTDLVFVEVDPTTVEAALLIAALDSELQERYPGLPIHGIEPVEFRRNGGVFLIGKLDGTPVACGALRPLSDSVGELKRMFVREEDRRRGFGRAMLRELERIANQRGYRTVRLETGTSQPEAIGLYERAGYRSIPCFGEYTAEPISRCFEKSLVS